jgi:hypothetical protein
MSQPEDLLTQFYPKDSYNFDKPPPQYVLGPITSILREVASKFQQLTTDITMVQGMASVQNATGVYLDAHGVLYGVLRLPGEPDSAFRTRILAALTAGKLTLDAIEDVVSNYYISISSNPSNAPTAYVYDLQSDPTTCAVDATAGHPIVINEFVVQITSHVNEDEIFFEDYWAWLGYTTYLFDTATIYNGAQPQPLAALVGQTKAAGTAPVWKNTPIVDTTILSPQP